MFAADASGQGVAAANVQRVHSDGAQTVDAVARYDAQQRQWVSVPIDLASPDDQVYLVLYGTGIRLRDGLGDVMARVGPLDLPVTFAGAHPDYPGLDQINVTLPRSLSGTGQVTVRVDIAGATSNVVNVSIR